MRQKRDDKAAVEGAGGTDTMTGGAGDDTYSLLITHAFKIPLPGNERGIFFYVLKFPFASLIIPSSIPARGFFGKYA